MRSPARCLALALLAAGALTLPAHADDAKCITTLNGNAAKVAKALGKDIRGCIKSADKKGLLGAETCSYSDLKGKVVKAKQKTLDQAVAGSQDKCGGQLPAFLYEGPSVANDAASRAAAGAAHDLFGPDLDTSVVTDGDKAKAKCRDTIYKDATGFFDVQLAEFNRCKKAALKAGAASTGDVEMACFLSDGIVDPKGKIGKSRSKLASDAGKKCAGLDTDTLFPGECVGQSGEPAFSTCAGRVTTCQACTALARMDGLDLDCDLFDDGADNLSCTRCGNGVIEGAEQCDDGNFAEGDGCSATCQIESTGALVFSDPCNGGSSLADEALAGLGIPVNVIVSSFGAFNTAFDAGGFDLVIYDGFCSDIDAGTRTRLDGWVQGGNRTIVAYWDLSGDTLETSLGVTGVQYDSGTFRDVYDDPASPVDLFTLRQSVPSPITGASSLTPYDMGQELTLTGAGFLAGRLDSDAGPGAIAVTNSDRSVVLGFTPEMVGANDDGAAVDADTDGVPDMQELWENLVAYLYSH
jgi:cysteine-rich repeat protein